MFGHKTLQLNVLTNSPYKRVELSEGFTLPLI